MDNRYGVGTFHRLKLYKRGWRELPSGQCHPIDILPGGVFEIIEVIFDDRFCTGWVVLRHIVNKDLFLQMDYHPSFGLNPLSPLEQLACQVDNGYES